MPATTLSSDSALSPWWPRSVAIVMVFGFAVLIMMSVVAYRNAPPIPATAVATNGEIAFTAEDVVAGQEVFLKYGLMNNGTIWGHGGYLGPDFSAQTLHGLALHLAGRIAQTRFQTPYANLGENERIAVDGAVAAAFRTNRHDAATGTLVLPIDAKVVFDEQVAYWTMYFADPAKNGGLAKNTVADPGELRALTAFFVWSILPEESGTLSIQPRWIGPRHTNYQDGSICAFSPDEEAWSEGGDIRTLRDLYSVWALRHLHLDLLQARCASVSSAVRHEPIALWAKNWVPR